MNIFNGKLFAWINKPKIEEGVKQIVSTHGTSLKKLELYDKGEIPLSKDMARYRGLQDYAQSLSKSL